MGDMLFEKFLDEMGINNADLFFFIAYHGIGKLLAEFETWLAHNDWLRSPNESAGDEDENDKTPKQIVNAAVEHTLADVDGLEKSSEWRKGALYVVDKVKEYVENE